MGAQLSKTAENAETAAEKPGEAAASPTKTNGQVNDILTSVRGQSGCCGKGGRGNAEHWGRHPCVIVDEWNGY